MQPPRRATTLRFHQHYLSLLFRVRVLAFGYQQRQPNHTTSCKELNRSTGRTISGDGNDDDDDDDIARIGRVRGATIIIYGSEDRKSVFTPVCEWFDDNVCSDYCNLLLKNEEYTGEMQLLITFENYHNKSLRIAGQKH